MSSMWMMQEAILFSTLNGRAFTEWVMPAIETAYQQQVTESATWLAVQNKIDLDLAVHNKIGVALAKMHSSDLTM